LAETTEATLFRNFGSKAQLFEATIAEPFAEFVGAWSNSFAHYPVDASLTELARKWVESLVDFVVAHRNLLKVLIAADFDGDPNLQPVARRISAAFASGLQRLLDAGGSDVVYSRSHSLIDPSATMAAEASMALGMIVLSDWVFPDNHNKAPDRERIIDELHAMILHGVTNRPKSS